MYVFRGLTSVVSVWPGMLFVSRRRYNAVITKVKRKILWNFCFGSCSCVRLRTCSGWFPLSLGCSSIFSEIFLRTLPALSVAHRRGSWNRWYDNFEFFSLKKKKLPCWKAHLYLKCSHVVPQSNPAGLAYLWPFPMKDQVAPHIRSWVPHPPSHRCV